MVPYVMVLLEQNSGTGAGTVDTAIIIIVSPKVADFYTKSRHCFLQ